MELAPIATRFRSDRSPAHTDSASRGVALHRTAVEQTALLDRRAAVRWFVRRYVPHDALTTLVACHLPGITDKGVAAMARMCKQLVQVDLSGCEALTRRAPESLFEQCPELTTCNLHGCGPSQSCVDPRIFDVRIYFLSTPLSSLNWSGLELHCLNRAVL